MKNINDVCVVIQARLTSERVPNKMAKPFGDTSLFEIGCKKLLESVIKLKLYLPEEQREH